MLALPKSPTPRAPSAELEARYLLPAYPPLPIEPVAGDGVWLETADGRRLLDFYGGHAVALLGHGHPRLLAALEAQARTLLFQTSAVPQAARARAAEALVALAPQGLDRVFFVSTGAEANENALRLAFRRTGRPKAVAIEGAFHGRTAAAAAVTCGRGALVRLPAASVRGRVRGARSGGARARGRRAHGGGDPRAGAGGGGRGAARPRAARTRRARRPSAPARCSSSTRCSAGSAASAPLSPRASTASPPTC